MSLCLNNQVGIPEWINWYFYSVMHLNVIIFLWNKISANQIKTKSKDLWYLETGFHEIFQLKD